jgi:ligand-binding SRPBCC domain-containing protein
VILRRTQWLARPLAELFPFFASPANLLLITPPWLGMRVLTPPPLVMKAGARFEYSVAPLGLPQRWVTLIESYDPPRGFTDVQEAGPYALWRHTHRFAEERGGTRMDDEIEYELPLGRLGRLGLPLVRLQLDGIFAYRAKALAALFP